jgi:hypothetical protein
MQAVLMLHATSLQAVGMTCNSLCIHNTRLLQAPLSDVGDQHVYLHLPAAARLLKNVEQAATAAQQDDCHNIHEAHTLG